MSAAKAWAAAALRGLSGDHSPLEMPWTRSGRASRQAEELHRVVLALEWEAAAGLPGRALLVVRALLWPVASLLRAFRLLRRHGAAVARRSGVGLARQLWQQVACANLLNVGPDAYYRYRLYLPANRRRALEFVQHFESSVIGLERVRQRCGFELDHKVAFHDRCRRAGLATVPLLAAFEAGRLVRWEGGAGGALPALDLILKPSNLDSGQGVECWRHDAASGGWRRGDAACSDLLEHARQASLEHACLLQQRVVNPRDLSVLAAGGLCTLRVVTCLDAGAGPRVLQAVLNIPTGQGEINNFGSGGLAAAVDVATGLLGPAFDDDVGSAPRLAHPTSGAIIAGWRLEGLQASLDLCLAAHAHFSGFHSIGWDVVPTPEGPLLLEANTIWDVDLAQRATGEPLATLLRADQVVARRLAHGAQRRSRLPLYGRGVP